MNSNLEEHRISVWAEAYRQLGDVPAKKKEAADAALAAFDAKFDPKKEVPAEASEEGFKLFAKLSPVLQRRVAPGGICDDIVHRARKMAHNSWWHAACNSVEEVIWYKVRSLLGYETNVRDLTQDDMAKVRTLKWEQHREFVKEFRPGRYHPGVEAMWLLFLALSELQREIGRNAKKAEDPQPAKVKATKAGTKAPRIHPDLRNRLGTAEETDEVLAKAYDMIYAVWQPTPLGSKSEAVWAYIMFILGFWDYDADKKARVTKERFAKLTLEEVVKACDAWAVRHTGLLQSNASETDRLAAGVVRAALRFTRSQLEAKEAKAKEAVQRAVREDLDKALACYVSCCRRFHGTLAGTSDDASAWADLVKAREYYEKLRKTAAGE